MKFLVSLLVIIIGVCGANSFAYGDIIKLSRGVSFEGKVIEETTDAYIVEMGVGVVEFAKDDVDDVEIFSTVENMKMLQDWENAEQEIFEQQKASSAAGNDNYDEDSLLNEANMRQDLVKFKGRYITPEVYDIVKKERAIKQRRYKYMQDEKRKKMQNEKARLKAKTAKQASELQKQQAQEEKALRFGTKETKKYGAVEKEEESIKTVPYTPYTEKTKSYGGSKYGTVDSGNTL